MSLVGRQIPKARTDVLLENPPSSNYLLLPVARRKIVSTVIINRSLPHRKYHDQLKVNQAAENHHQEGLSPLQIFLLPNRIQDQIRKIPLEMRAEILVLRRVKPEFLLKILIKTFQLR